MRSVGLQIPYAVVPSDLRRHAGFVDDDGDYGIAHRHERGMLQFPGHHGTPEKGAFLGRDGFFGIPLLAVACLHLDEIERAILLGDDVHLLVLMPPVARQYLEAPLHQLFSSQALAPSTKFVVTCHNDYLFIFLLCKSNASFLNGQEFYHIYDYQVYDKSVFRKEMPSVIACLWRKDTK